MKQAGPRARMTLFESHRRLGIRVREDGKGDGGGGGGGGEGGGGCASTIPSPLFSSTATTWERAEEGRWQTHCVEDARVPLVSRSDAQRLAEERMHWKHSLPPMLSGEGSRDEQVYARDQGMDEIQRSTDIHSVTSSYIVSHHQRSTTRAVSIERKRDDIYAQGARAFLLTQRDEMDLQRVAATSGNFFFCASQPTTLVFKKLFCLKHLSIAPLYSTYTNVQIYRERGY